MDTENEQDVQATMPEEENQPSGLDVAKDNRKKNRPTEAIGSLWDNIKGAFKGNAKDIFVLKGKLIIYGVIAALIFIALIAEGVAEDTSKVVTDSVTQMYKDSTADAGKLYNETGSLLLATEEELEEIKNNYFEQIENTNKAYYDAFNIKYNGKESNTVANRIAHITKNIQATLSEEVNVITDKTINVAGEVLPSDNRTIFEHILRTEKYNFNNIIWRSFVKSGDGVVQSSITLRVDDKTKLKYPVADSAASNSSSLDLDFFISKVRPFLQSWYIPFDLMVGTQGAQDQGVLNTDFAYEIITSAYHEIVMDRYKLENLNRKTNYLVYDKTTTTVSTTRNCASYRVPEDTVIRSKGDNCTKADYNAGRCVDSKMQVQCSKMFVIKGWYGCSDTSQKITCDDINWPLGCAYGKLKEDVRGSTSTTSTYCTDVELEDTNEERDIRESKVADTTETDKLTYSWNYLVSSAKMFDRVIAYEFSLSPYHQYSLDNYNKFINKTGDYGNMTVEEFRKSEIENSKSDIFTPEEKDYNEEETETETLNTNWNEEYVVERIPEGATMVVGTTVSRVIKKDVKTVKTGKEYTDTYFWSDELGIEETKSGIYNIDSVIDVTGDDLTADDLDYYQGIANSGELNLIDLMNSDKEIYDNYMDATDRSNLTENIGIRKSSLDISYNVLKKDLRTLVETYPITVLLYGESLDILDGLNLGLVAGAYVDIYSLKGDSIDYSALPVNKLGWPFNNLEYPKMVVTSCFMKNRVIAGVVKDHKALDISIAGNNGTYGPPILASQAGKVVHVHKGCPAIGRYGDKCGGGWGNYVVVDHQNGYYTLYAHMYTISVSKGDEVTAGQLLGIMGTSGSSTGVHLHWEVRYGTTGYWGDSKTYNPMVFLDRSTAPEQAYTKCVD